MAIKILEVGTLEIKDMLLSMKLLPLLLHKRQYFWQMNAVKDNGY